jgi:hypothetical protein
LGNAFLTLGNGCPISGSGFPTLGNVCTSLRNYFPTLGNGFPILKNGFPRFGKGIYPQAAAVIHPEKVGKVFAKVKSFPRGT